MACRAKCCQVRRLLIDLSAAGANYDCLTDFGENPADHHFALHHGRLIATLPEISQIDLRTLSQNEPAFSISNDSTFDQAEHEVPFKSATLRGMKIHMVSRLETVEYLMDCASDQIGGWVVTPNLDILRRYTRSISFRNLMATSTLNVADGMPLVWASRVNGQPLPERVNGTDLMIDICEAASATEKSVFFLGGNSGSAEKTAEAMKKDFPGLKIAGFYCPKFGFENSIEYVEKIAKILTAADPDFVFVGLGSPKQDVLINMLRLKLPKVWWLGVGVSFSFIAGELPRAPEWAKKSGFEWLYRLCAEPQRLFKRYLVTGVPFLISTLAISAFKRVFWRKPNEVLESGK